MGKEGRERGTEVKCASNLIYVVHNIPVPF